MDLEIDEDAVEVDFGASKTKSASSSSSATPKYSSSGNGVKGKSVSKSDSKSVLKTNDWNDGETKPDMEIVTLSLSSIFPISITATFTSKCLWLKKS